jgi:hypothetical protein
MLKNKKFMGQIKSQYARVKSKPIIAEVNDHKDSSNSMHNVKNTPADIHKYIYIQKVFQTLYLLI